VTEATNGEAGLAAFIEARRPFDLVVTDVVMPGAVSGRALAEEVRWRSPNTPVILMSGYTDDAVPPGELGPGLHLIEKPFRKRDLARLIRTVLDGSR
jgi:DNA-binding NtrC family response regulator